ncbi:hypothetical protein FF011L_26530 [Roseimaritima multifibrata]|uniref:Chromosome partition protein Smc n=1 Tax=Roseimaritima multifibrata TaxID=1930274 RepID=A0A517MGI6_9BACT|nr:hypothetical protein [Roseimaritima multifibrata]QDS93877.1 hypothetical protein FF011L_26530 [Roseimaritima multifibrata]
MQDPVLFPLHEDLIPNANRTEPLVWIRELVILHDPNPSNWIRKVPFECGLNIIRTEERSDLEEDVVAHSVGKTLLMRLIRYTAGEANYAAEESQAELAKVVPSGVVVAHWRVDGDDWIVRRPLHDHEPAASIVVKSDAWEDAFDDAVETIPFKSFLKQIDRVIVGDLPRFEIAKDRLPRWADVLGWLARDCECGYRQANEWRHAGTNLGQPGDLNINKLMMQWLCGLMSEDEAKLRNEHRHLQSEQRKAKAAAEKHSRSATLREESLRDSMEGPKVVSDEPAKESDLFSNEPTPSLTLRAESMLAQSHELLREVRENTQVAKLETRVSVIQSKLDQANRAAGEASGNLTSSKKYQRDLKQVQAEPPLLNKCPADPCKLREELQRHRELGQDESIDEKKSDAEETVRQQTEQAKQANDACEAFKKELENANQELEVAKSKLAESESKLNEQIGRWKQHVVDAKRVDTVTKESASHNTAVADLAKAVDVSNARQETAREAMDHLQCVSQASVAYTQVLQRVFKESATGTIQVDGKGLQPKPAKELTPGGRALSAMATVVSFDLACVMASIAGIGNHPRFLIHDSPREGEMEMPLFKRIFDVACYLESCFGESPPSFQHIVTTTKAPPSYCTQDEPHTRLILHGREPEGRLLKLTF